MDRNFTSKDFDNFLTKHGVKHVLTALYSPQANASERVNRVINEALRSYVRSAREIKCNVAEAGTLHSLVNEILQRYRATHLSSGKSPADLYLNLLVLHIKNNKTIWIGGSILEKYGQLHYLVQLDDGYVLKRHIIQLKCLKIQKRYAHFDTSITVATLNLSVIPFYLLT
uniref:Integrase catalytic domain-containing protein n=1 Tax=Stomoxys calcitrans TaxID=35570 RepID=A0A1I8Q2L2_STOCA